MYFTSTTMFIRRSSFRSNGAGCGCKEYHTDPSGRPFGGARRWEEETGRGDRPRLWDGGESGHRRRVVRVQGRDVLLLLRGVPAGLPRGSRALPDLTPVREAAGSGHLDRGGGRPRGV